MHPDRAAADGGTQRRHRGAAGGGTAGAGEQDGGQPQPMAGRDRTGGTAGSGAAGTGEQDGGQPQPMATPTTIGLVNATNAPVYAQTSDCTAIQHGSASARTIASGLFLDCAVRLRDEPDGPHGLPGGLPRMEFQKLEPGGGIIRFEWDGMHWTYGTLGLREPRCARGRRRDRVELLLDHQEAGRDIPGFPQEPSSDDLTCGMLAAKIGSASPTLRFTIDP